MAPKNAKDDKDYKQYPDTDILFEPINGFVRELFNNRDQLRSLMKPRMPMVWKKPAGKKKTAGKGKKPVMKKPAGKGN